MASAQKLIQVDFGTLTGSVEQRVKSGRYASVDEVVRAGLLALERDEAEVDEWIMKMVDEALANPEPPILLDEAFQKIRQKHGIIEASVSP